MDSDELATPGYQVLSPAIKIKLATLPIGELMVRHPHFTQPIFVRFPRPAVLRGRDGVERFPPAADLPFEDAVVRQLVKLDRRGPPRPAGGPIAPRRGGGGARPPPPPPPRPPPRPVGPPPTHPPRRGP